MGFLPWLVGAIILGSIISAALKSASTPALQTGFISLGNLIGKTQAEIVQVVGSPNSVSALGDGRYLAQWMAPDSRYHIALIFTAAAICEGISHEHVAPTT